MTGNTKNKRRVRSKITGVKFNVQDRSVRNHGPLPKRQRYQNAIVETINSPFMDEWRTTEEVSREASKSIPRHWKQITPYVLGQIVRPLIRDGYVVKTKTNNISSYKRKRFIK